MDLNGPVKERSSRRSRMSRKKKRNSSVHVNRGAAVPVKRLALSSYPEH